MTAVTVAGAAGMWGDSHLSTPQLLADGRADYLIYEALAEVTMAILTRARARDQSQGYARDVIETIAAHLRDYHERGIRVITNAGGVQPAAAADLLRAAARQAGIRIRVATVTGDDLTARVDELQAAGALSLGKPGAIAQGHGPPLSLHAYLGARPIAAALGHGADVVVTGRVVDSALVLGPLLHEFGWRPDDVDQLAAGSLAGHLLECGPQATGGLLTDWNDTASWADPGYPVAEVRPNGTFVVTAPTGSDALVDVRTVAEQLLYEIGDPSAYVLPDVVCDWTQVRLRDLGANRVEVTGARGRAPTPTLKACAQVADGWRATFLLLIAGRDAVPKARRAAADLLERGGRMLAAAGLPPFRATHTAVLGAEDTYGGHARRGDTREVVLQLAVHHDAREAVARFVREVPSLGLAGPPGVSGGGAGLPRPTPLLRLQCGLVPRELVPTRVVVDGVAVPSDDVPNEQCRPLEASPDRSEADASPPGLPATTTADVPLIAIAHGRSGDKGADLNIGLRARHPDFLPTLRATVTAEAVGAWLAHLGPDRIDRYDMPGIDAVNLVLQGALGAGGTASLRFDPQGKAVAQQLLDLPVPLPIDLLDHPALRGPEDATRFAGASGC